MSSPKEFHIDAVYPEHLSRLRRGHGLSNSCNESPSSPSYRRAVRKQMRRGTTGAIGRFRTQPVTFHEIQEVDEENLVETEPDKASSAGSASKSESDLKAKFELFYRSIGAHNNNDKNSVPSNEGGTSSTTTTTANIPIPNPATTILTTTTFAPIFIKKHHLMSQDDSSTLSSQNHGAGTSTNPNFNPKSRPSL